MVYSGKANFKIFKFLAKLIVSQMNLSNPLEKMFHNLFI